MNVTKTTKSKILSGDDDLKRTIAVYRSGLTHVAKVVLDNWGAVSAAATSQLKQQVVERLILPTKNRHVLPDNDLTTKFHKFPCYFRRALITETIGAVSSHMSRIINWRNLKTKVEAKGKKFSSRPPVFQYEPNVWPVFYYKNMFEGEPSDYISKNAPRAALMRIKVFRNNDWVWKEIEVETQSFQKRSLSVYSPGAPTLVRRHGGYAIHIPWERSLKLPDIKELEAVRICAVDSNLGNDAVAVAMDATGTVLARRFIRFDREKDRLTQAIDRISRANRLSGIGPKPNLWRRTNNLKEEIVNRTVTSIIDFATEYGCHVIVAENLKSLRPKGSRREKVHHWRIMAIHHKLEDTAHHNGMRYSTINPCNTSKLAFDGSGMAKRPGKGKLLIFKSGKVYNADLNAAYNIGARYFVREMFNRLSKKQQGELRAKVPALQPGSGTSLDTLVTGWMGLNPLGTRTAMP